MAMVNITNGEVVSKVPFAAFQSQYKSMGFWLADEPKGAVEVPEVEDNTTDNAPEDTSNEDDSTDGQDEDTGADEGTEDEDDEDNSEDEDAMFVEDILEKPLSQWSTDELKEFVRIKDIDTTGAKKTSEVRSIVKKFLEEQEKAAANS